MGIPEMDGSTVPVKKRQRLSLKAGRRKVDTEQSPSANFNNSAQKQSSKQESESSESITTVTSSLSSSTVDSNVSSVTDTSTSTSTDVSSSNSKVDVRVPAVASLENLGNTCFMNSIMQVLRYTPGFLNNLALLYQDIQSSAKIKRKNKSNDDEPQSFAEDMNKRCCKVVKNVYKVYRDLTMLEEKYEEVASDDVMSMAVKPNKILSAIRDLNPMYEGHMQHDAQEFLRCFLCYFQDAEKEVQKFYSQLPHTFSPKINPIMQRFLASSSASQETKDKIVKIVNEISETNNKLSTENVIETEKVKVNLFPKVEMKTETAKSPTKIQKVPNVGDTAVVVDKMNEQVTYVGASTEPLVSKHLPSGEMHVDLKGVGVTKLPSTSELVEGTQSEFKGVIGKQQRPKGLARRNRRVKPYDKDEKSQRPKRDSSNKVTRKRRCQKSNKKDDGVSDGLDCDIKNEQKSSTIIPLQSRNENVCDEKTAPVISKFENTVENKVEGARSYQDVFSQFLSALPEDDTDSVEMQSDSDNEDIVLKKIKEKQLRNSPRRSPRKTTSEMLKMTPRKLEISKLALTTKSESSIETVRHHLDFSGNKSDLERKNGMECNINASQNAISDIPTIVSQFIVKSEMTEDGDDMTGSTQALNIEAGIRMEQNVDHLPAPVALVPVVKLENCDYILTENGTSVSAAYATKCLTPIKNERRSSTGSSSNYLKQRNQPVSMDISDDEEFKRAVAEMLNSPVKSRSKYDLIERTFQGSMMLRTRCLQCESFTERQEDFHDVSVPVRIEKADSDDEDEEETESKCDLLDLIEASTEVEKLLEDNKYYCDECKGYVEAERSMHYDVMPDILTLHLKRFSSETRNPSNITKINDHVDIPITLPCLRYKCSQSCLRPDHRYRLYGVVTHSGVTLTSGHYLAYVRSLPNQPSENTQKKQQNITVNTDNKNIISQINDKENSEIKSEKSAPATRRKMGVATKLPSRFDNNVIANTKVKAFQSVTMKKVKPDLVASLLPSKHYEEEWFECDDETVRVFDESDFVELLSEKSGSLLGTPYLLFYHKATMC